jgi:hypothetical protein
MRPTSNFDFILRPDDISWPNMLLWNNLMSSYFDRELTYEGDILPAITGVLNAFGASTFGGFQYDLPETFFDAAVLWIPTGPLKRRMAGEQYSSWSRMGWSGPTKSQIVPFGLLHTVRRTDTWEQPDKWNRVLADHLYPTVRWWKCGKFRGKTEVISNNYLMYCAEDLGRCDFDPPVGWTVNIEPEFDKPYYTFDGAPANEAFWYPMPIAGKSDSSSGPRTRFLRISTSLIRLKLEEAAKTGDFPQDYPARFILRTVTGSWAGTLFHHGPRTVSNGQDLQLAKISGGQLFEDPDQGSWYVAEWGHEERPRIGDTYEYYNALCVKRLGTFFERCGLARVPKVVWDDLSTGEREIVLG